LGSSSRKPALTLGRFLHKLLNFNSRTATPGWRPVRRDVQHHFDGMSMNHALPTPRPSTEDCYWHFALQKIYEQARVDLKLAPPHNARWRDAAVGKEAWAARLREEAAR
jgi:hypothetical protein